MSRLERTRIDEISGVSMHWATTCWPTNPVAPVTMTFMARLVQAQLLKQTEPGIFWEAGLPFKRRRKHDK